jgi:hypothetical protein
VISQANVEEVTDMEVTATMEHMEAVPHTIIMTLTTRLLLSLMLIPMFTSQDAGAHNAKHHTACHTTLAPTPATTLTASAEIAMETASAELDQLLLRTEDTPEALCSMLVLPTEAD